MRHCSILLIFLWAASSVARGLPVASAGQDRALFSPAAAPGFGAGEAIGFLPVEEAYQLVPEITGERQLRLHFRIADGYYLYKKRFSFSLEDASGEIETEVGMGEGVVREDEYFGVSEVFYNYADIALELARPTGAATLTVKSQGCADAGLCYPPRRQVFSVDFDSGAIAAAPPKRPDSAAASAPPPRTGIRALPSMMLLAFLGGVILNLMPCVFPVLSLKVLSFTTGGERAKHVHGWVYAAGVVASFVLAALLLVALRQAGAAVGWGFQLQSPRFVAALAYLFFAMGLALSGLIEIGAGLMGAGGRLADRGGYGGSFFTGVLAAVVASPCTAPFMGTALGFAVTQPAPVAVAVFAALGGGMAAPMLLLGYSRFLRERMPRPGPWMETFRQLLAFPLYATAIWLLWVGGRQTSVSSMALLLCGMLALALGFWLWRYRPWGRLAGAAAIAGALSVIPGPALERPEAAHTSERGFDERRLESLLAAGRPVFVNVTADWCITCIANERGALGAESVETALAAGNVAYLVVDWTNYDADVAEFLARFGRSGVPLYLLYSGRPGEPPRILPQLLTPGIIRRALENIRYPPG